MIPLPAFRQQAEIFLMAHLGRPEVVLNDKNRHLSVGRNYQSAPNPFADIHSMTALLPGETKPSAHEYALERSPIDWRNSWHQKLNADCHFPPLHGDPLRTFPVSLRPAIPGLLKNFIERSHFSAGGNKTSHRLINARRASSGVAPELATSRGIAWAIYWLSSRQIRTV